MISVLGLTAINILSLFLFIKSTNNARIKYELELLKHQSELEKKNYTELGVLCNQIKHLRHDFQQHLIGIKNLVYNNEKETIHQYLIQTEKSLCDITIIHTNNRMFDYIINTKISTNSDITFLITGECIQISNINEFDLASLMGNLLDNAIEASRESDDRIIEIQFFIKDNYQNIICKNTIRKSVLTSNPSLVSTKQFKSKHGYGIASMKRIINDVNGYIDFYEEEQHFCVHIAVPFS